MGTGPETFEVATQRNMRPFHKTGLDAIVRCGNELDDPKDGAM